MKRNLFSLFLFCFLVGIAMPFRAEASMTDQSESGKIIPKKERRIFLWDVTISMVGATAQTGPGIVKGTKRSNPDFNYADSTKAGAFKNYNASKDIFDKTRQTLINLIDGIRTESTEVIVLPFRDKIVGPYKSDATADGKAKLKKYIMEWNDLKRGETHTGSCLQEALSYFTSDRRNHVILLTDGEPSGGEGAKLLRILDNWNGDKVTEGIGDRLTYVMLTDEAVNEEIQQRANENEAITVILPSENLEEMCSLSVGHNTSIHVRDFFDGTVASNGKGTFELPFTFEGPAIPKDYKLHLSIEDNDFVDVETDVKVIGNKFVIPFTLKKTLAENISELPHDSNLTLVLTMKEDSVFKNVNIVDGREAMVELVLKAEPRVKISWSIQ